MNNKKLKIKKKTYASRIQPLSCAMFKLKKKKTLTAFYVLIRV